MVNPQAAEEGSELTLVLFCMQGAKLLPLNCILRLQDQLELPEYEIKMADILMNLPLT